MRLITSSKDIGTASSIGSCTVCLEVTNSVRLTVIMPRYYDEWIFLSIYNN